jgi:hypothetical protein
LGRDGRIKVTDFGAAVNSRLKDITQVSGLGSAAYMSPQQIDGQTLSFQADIYSLGIVLFKMLTGRLPFAAHSLAALAEEIKGQDIAPPSRFRAEIPPELDAVIQRATARDLARRYASWDKCRGSPTTLRGATGRFSYPTKIASRAVPALGRHRRGIRAVFLRRMASVPAERADPRRRRDIFRRGQVRVMKNAQQVDGSSPASGSEVAYPRAPRADRGRRSGFNVRRRIRTCWMLPRRREARRRTRRTGWPAGWRCNERLPACSPPASGIFIGLMLNQFDTTELRTWRH